MVVILFELIWLHISDNQLLPLKNRDSKIRIEAQKLGVERLILGYRKNDENIKESFHLYPKVFVFFWKKLLYNYLENLLYQ